MDTGRCCNEAPVVHICRRGDGSAIYAEGRGVSPSCPVGRSPRDRRPGGPRLSRSFGEAALMPLYLVRPARRAGRRLTGRAAILAAHHPPTYQPTNQRTNKPTNHPPTKCVFPRLSDGRHCYAVPALKSRSKLRAIKTGNRRFPGKAAILAAHWDNGRLARCSYVR